MIRLYSSDDGHTHIEELELEDHPEMATLQSAAGIVFSKFDAGYFSDWHRAPRRQYVITISGEVEIGLRDGSLHRFGSGHVTLA